MFQVLLTERQYSNDDITIGTEETHEKIQPEGEP
jgi:hypothetical protein